MKIRNLFRPAYVGGRLVNWMYEKRHPDHPWLAPQAIAWLDDHLRPEMTGFEWGSGRSTLWFSSRLKKLTSIEHDPDWAQKVRSNLAAAAVSNASLQFIPLEHPNSETYANDYPVLPAYVRAIEPIPDQSLDFVVVDGWYRPVCARSALPKLKQGGYLLIDNTDWDDPPHFHVPADWLLVHRSQNVLTETSIWRKPDSP